MTSAIVWGYVVIHPMVGVGLLVVLAVASILLAKTAIPLWKSARDEKKQNTSRQIPFQIKIKSIWQNEKNMN